jgi:hypothetical protein
MGDIAPLVKIVALSNPQRSEKLIYYQLIKTLYYVGAAP